MKASIAVQPEVSHSFAASRAVEANEPECLTSILRDHVNLAVWHRNLDAGISRFVTDLLGLRTEYSTMQYLSVTRPEDMALQVSSGLPTEFVSLHGFQAWLDDITLLIDMYCCLFEPQMVGFRLHIVDRAMCPRFHVDRVPVRLLCTYGGLGTQWLEESSVVRPDEPDARLPEQITSPAQIQSVPTGSVALLKGSAWIGNEAHGIVHRSPPASTDDTRLILGLDWL
ncbi:MAG: DUF1826 domain-containing protein [Pseudomonadales bacterium]|nr:DUF1826 domain-containing protein [Pseudomonadales bacterium]